MSVVARPVRLTFDDYVRYTEMHDDAAFELVDGVIFELAPEGDSHGLTRSAIDWYLNAHLDLARYAPFTELSFPAPDWFDGPRPDNFVARGPGLVDGVICPRPTASAVALVIEVASTSRRKDERRALLYARLAIAEFWLVDIGAGSVVVYDAPSLDAEAPSYRNIRPYRKGETIRSSSVDDLSVEAAFLLQLSNA